MYFGSFNPLHNGHLIVAQHMLNSGYFDKIRFVVSPQNPFKKENGMLPEDLRLKLVTDAVADNPGFEVSKVEFGLPKPSYTIETVKHFLIENQQDELAIVMGSDNLEKLHLWKNIDELASLVNFHIYLRRGSEHIQPKVNGNFIYHEAPFLDISATYIREILANGQNARYLLPDKVWNMLKRTH